MNLTISRHGNATIQFQIPHIEYLNKFLKSNSCEELFWLFQNAEKPAKEVTESMAALKWMKRFTDVSKWQYSTHKRAIFHIGDGSRPRTAGIFSFFTKSSNISIDPQLDIEWFLNWVAKYNVVRLAAYRSAIEESINWDRGEYLITNVHSHANLEEVDKVLPNWRLLYTNPCCCYEKQTFSREYMSKNNISLLLNKRDLGIQSTHNEVFVYKKYFQDSDISEEELLEYQERQLKT